MVSQRVRTVCLAFLGVACLVQAPRALGGQEPTYPTQFSPALAGRPLVKQALTWIETNLPKQVEEWIHITEIPAPSRHEEKRAAYVKAQFEQEGLATTVDEIGNVIGRRPGTGGRPTLVFAAHMDTVHPMETNVTVRRDGNILRAPGVFDDSSSVADMLAVIRAQNRAKIQTTGTLVFIATTQEELGLRGMTHWLEKNPGVADLVVAIDGGLGPVNYGALGINWTRYTFKAEGAHTNSSRGKPHPARALADAIRSIYEIDIPQTNGGGVCNVGMVSGGTVINAIPQEVSFTVDLRSVNPETLDRLQADIDARVTKAAALNKVEWSEEKIQREKAGGTEDMLKAQRAHPLVQTAIDIHRFLGIDIGQRGAVASGSTDSNAAVVRNIPSISVGRTRGGDQHTLQEWAEIDGAAVASKMLLLIALSMAGMA
jgi:tripeptide aminopeptidase